jgi:hypothetical protein
MPDIPGVAPAENLMALGEGLMRVGSALGRVRAPKEQPVDDSAAKAFLDAEIFSEVTQATNLANQKAQEYINGLSGNPDAGSYYKGWVEKAQEIENETSKILARPEAVKKFHEGFWTIKKKDVGDAASEMGTSLKIAQTEGIANDTIAQAVVDGDIRAIEETAKFAREQGVLSPEEVESIRDNEIPKAKYNRVINALYNMGYDAQQATLNQDDAPKALDLTPEQISTALDFFKKRNEIIVASNEKEVKLNNGVIEEGLASLVIKYMQGGIKQTGFKTIDDLWSHIGAQNWLGPDSGDLTVKWAKMFKEAVSYTPTEGDILSEPGMQDILLKMASTNIGEVQKIGLATDALTGKKISLKGFEYALDNMKGNDPQLAYEIQKFIDSSKPDVDGKRLISIEEANRGILILNKAIRDATDAGKTLSSQDIYDISTQTMKITMDPILSRKVESLMKTPEFSFAGIKLWGGKLDDKALISTQTQIQEGAFAALGGTTEMVPRIAEIRKAQIESFAKSFPNIKIDEAMLGQKDRRGNIMVPQADNFQQYLYDAKGNAYAMAVENGKRVWKFQAPGEKTWKPVK